MSRLYHQPEMLRKRIECELPPWTNRAQELEKIWSELEKNWQRLERNVNCFTFCVKTWGQSHQVWIERIWVCQAEICPEPGGFYVKLSDVTPEPMEIL